MVLEVVTCVDVALQFDAFDFAPRLSAGRAVAALAAMRVLVALVLLAMVTVAPLAVARTFSVISSSAIALAATRIDPPVDR